VRATAVLPIKRFAAAKSRLSGSAADPLRPELAAAMLADVLAALARSRRVDGVIVVSGEPAARLAAGEAGAGWRDDPDDRGHSEAAAIGVSAAVEAGAECAALLPGDCPLLDPAELDAALERMEDGSCAVVPDRHGAGTNALLLAPPDGMGASFGPGSRARHLQLAAEAGLAGRVEEIPSLALDLDTPEDLAELARVLRADPGLAPATAAVLGGAGPSIALAAAG
jgi:2-phospho-L-lactate guanylyltransferase